MLAWRIAKAKRATDLSGTGAAIGGAMERPGRSGCVHGNDTRNLLLGNFRARRR